MTETPPAIEVENLGKEYLIRHDVESSSQGLTFREYLNQRFQGIFTGKQARGLSSKESFSALKDVSFTVPQGEILGIIGTNGAGKSTLLKLLSRITGPTSGRIKLYGRIASLLEVGTGFHPELTGKENIYLNGSILGMTRKEIAAKLSSIVEFAEVSKFLDTPVKRYSSGMYVRLAFAIAAHLDPEILLVDEVLAVGDIHFQKKCLGKMDDIAQSGRTVIFVSHNMNTIRKLCTRCLYLDEGRLIDQGDCDTMISKYLSEQSISNQCSVDLKNPPRKTRRRGAQFTAIHLKDKNQEPCHIFSMGESMEICVETEYETDNQSFVHSIMIADNMGQSIYSFRDRDNPELQTPKSKKLSISILIETLKLYPGKYTISLWLGDLGAKPIDDIKSCISFEVTQGTHYSLWPLGKENGSVLETCHWEFKGQE